MSQPKRYTIECVHAGTRREDPNGLWCAYSDVAALQAENERLQGHLAGRDALIMGRDSIIKCREDEIELLVTAGDGIAEILRNIDHSSAFIAAWNEAKATLEK